MDSWDSWDFGDSDGSGGSDGPDGPDGSDDSDGPDGSEDQKHSGWVSGEEFFELWAAAAQSSDVYAQSSEDARSKNSGTKNNKNGDVEMSDASNNGAGANNGSEAKAEDPSVAAKKPWPLLALGSVLALGGVVGTAVGVAKNGLGQVLGLCASALGIGALLYANENKGNDLSVGDGLKGSLSDLWSNSKDVLRNVLGAFQALNAQSA